MTRDWPIVVCELMLMVRLPQRGTLVGLAMLAGSLSDAEGAHSRPVTRQLLYRNVHKYTDGYGTDAGRYFRSLGRSEQR